MLRKTTLGLILVLLLVGGVMLYQAYVDWEMARRSSAQPETIALKDLLARGPGGNPHILLTDYVLCDPYVHNTTMAKDGKPWTRLWAPIIPGQPGAEATGPENRPSSIQALLYSRAHLEVKEMVPPLAKPPLAALVITDVAVESKEREALRTSYPATDFSKCLIIEANRAPAGRGKLIGLGVAGAVCLLLGIGFALRSLKASS